MTAVGELDGEAIVKLAAFEFSVSKRSLAGAPETPFALSLRCVGVSQYGSPFALSSSKCAAVSRHRTPFALSSSKCVAGRLAAAAGYAAHGFTRSDRPLPVPPPQAEEGFKARAVGAAGAPKTPFALSLSKCAAVSRHRTPFALSSSKCVAGRLAAAAGYAAHGFPRSVRPLPNPPPQAEEGFKARAVGAAGAPKTPFALSSSKCAAGSQHRTPFALISSKCAAGRAVATAGHAAHGFPRSDRPLPNPPPQAEEGFKARAVGAARAPQTPFALSLSKCAPGRATAGYAAHGFPRSDRPLPNPPPQAEEGFKAPPGAVTPLACHRPPLAADGFNARPGAATLPACLPPPLAGEGRGGGGTERGRPRAGTERQALPAIPLPASPTPIARARSRLRDYRQASFAPRPSPQHREPFNPHSPADPSAPTSASRCSPT
jgi:type 1 fimbria pilin